MRYFLANQREARHALGQLEAALAAMGRDANAPLEGQLAAVSAMRTALERHARYLWPSERERAQAAALSQERETLDRVATRELAATLGIEDERRRLLQIAQVLGGSAEWFTRASNDWRTRQTSVLEAERRRIAQRLVRPYLERMERERSLEAVLRLDGEIGRIEDVLAAADEDTRRGFSATRAQWASDAVAQEVAGALAALQSAPTGRAGIRANAELAAAFERRFQAFGTEQSVKRGAAGFEADRRRRLREGLVEFERELRTLAADARPAPQRVRALAQEFLTSAADWNRPVALEYRIVAAVYGTPLR